MQWFSPEMNDGRSVFVFGSNLAGRHGAGAALVAVTAWGAQRGNGQGPKGQAYAIPTKDARLSVLPLSQINTYVDAFIAYALLRPHTRFLITEIGCGLAGYATKDIAPMFRRVPDNCVLTDNFNRFLRR